MKGGLILDVIHIVGTKMIKAGIDGLSWRNNLGGMTKGMNHLQFFLLDQVAAAKSAKLEPWIRTWWGESLRSLSAKDWFKHKVDNLLWGTPLTAEDTALEILLNSRIQRPYKSHVMVVPWLMKFSWRNQMGKEAELLFSVPVGIPCWGLGEHEPLIIALFLPIVSRRKWKGQWTIR